MVQILELPLSLGAIKMKNILLTLIIGILLVGTVLAADIPETRIYYEVVDGEEYAFESEAFYCYNQERINNQTRCTTLDWDLYKHLELEKSLISKAEREAREQAMVDLFSGTDKTEEESNDSWLIRKVNALWNWVQDLLGRTTTMEEELCLENPRYSWC